MLGRLIKSAPPKIAQGYLAPLPLGKSAQIYSYPKEKLPAVEDYRRACADLIWATFREKSLNAVCDRAEQETGQDADKFCRILTGETKQPAGYLMKCVERIAAGRSVPIPAALAVRIEAATQHITLQGAI